MVITVIINQIINYGSNKTPVTEARVRSGPGGVKRCQQKTRAASLLRLQLQLVPLCPLTCPGMGGAYMTLLNTIANMGYILPKSPIFYLIDLFTVTRCAAPGGATTFDDASR